MTHFLHLLFPPPSNLLSLSPGGGCGGRGAVRQKTCAVCSKSLSGVHFGESDGGALALHCNRNPAHPSLVTSLGSQSLVTSSFISLPITLLQRLISMLLCLASWHPMLPPPKASLTQALLKLSQPWSPAHCLPCARPLRKKYFLLVYQF